MRYLMDLVALGKKQLNRTLINVDEKGMFIMSDETLKDSLLIEAITKI